MHLNFIKKVKESVEGSVLTERGDIRKCGWKDKFSEKVVMCYSDLLSRMKGVG